MRLKKRKIADKPEFDLKAHQKVSLQPVTHLTSQNIPARHSECFREKSTSNIKGY